MTIEEQTAVAAYNYAAEKNSPTKMGNAINDFISGAEWERQRDKWISVEDQPPPKAGYYIAMCISPYQEPGLIHFHPRTGWENGFYEASHWQPLPEPPKTK